MSETFAQPTRQIEVRVAEPADIPVIFDLIRALAIYEKLLHEVIGSTALLEAHLFGDRPYIETLLAEVDGKPAGFALFFPSYYAVSAQPGIYLEDLFVLPEYRGQGIGRALLRQLCSLACDRHADQLEWSVLDWNQPAIDFYHRIGAELLENIRVCRVTGAVLQQLAAKSSPSIRFAVPADCAALAELARANAAHHHVLSEFRNAPDLLNAHLFGTPSHAEAIVADDQGGITGFALFYHNYSTFLTKPGIYVEDLFVLPDHRHQGIGKALLHFLAQQAIERDCGRLEWFVQIWNTDTIAFYRRLGATILDDWRICRLNQAAIASLIAS